MAALGLGLLTAQGVAAQAPQFLITIDPPAGSVMVTQTVNAIFVQVRNPELFTNIQVQLTPPPLGPQAFLDDGNPPDLEAEDAIFSGAVVMPALTASTNLTLTFVTRGLDLNATNEAGEVDPEALVFSTNQVDYIVVVRPPNDDFVNAIKVPATGQLIRTTNNWATLEAGEPVHADFPGGDASIWWNWSSPVSTNVLVDTAGSTFEPLLAVYRGGSPPTLEPVAGSSGDPQRGLLANVNFLAEAGITYRIAVASRNAEEAGDVRLRVAPGWQADVLEPVVTILSPGAETLVDQPVVLISGTAKDSDPYPSGLRWVTVTLNNEPPVLADGLGTWSTRLTLPPGTNIVQAVAYDYAGHASQPHTLVIRYLNPTNHLFASAMALTGLGGRVDAVTGRAYREPDEPFHGGNEGGRSIWYTFRAPAPGRLFLSTEGSSFDTLLGLYRGESLAGLVAVAQNDDAHPGSGFSEILADVEAGVLYSIAVDGYGGEFGEVALEYAFVTTGEYYSVRYGPLLGGVVTPPAGLFPAGATEAFTAVPARDFTFVVWDGTAVSSQNPLVLPMNQNYFLVPRFQVISHTEDFETGAFGRLQWSFEGAAPWEVQSHARPGSRFVARSGPILDNAFSALILSTTTVAGTGSFDVMVSSEKGWDWLEFYVNGLLRERWSGLVPWQTFLFPVADGFNRFEWRYSKDANFSAGLDAAFLDNLYLPLADPVLAAALGIARLPDDTIQVTVRGRPGRTYQIQISTDLAAWSAVHSEASPDGIFAWRDPESITAPARYYRAVLE